MSKLKVLELAENQPLSKVEGMFDAFIDEQEKAGNEVDVEEIEHFEHSFHRTHGVMVRYDVYYRPPAKPTITEKRYADNPAVSQPEPAPAGEAGESGGLGDDSDEFPTTGV